MIWEDVDTAADDDAIIDSSNSASRRASKQTTVSTGPPLLPQQQYYSPLSLSPQAAYQFQSPQPFPSFQQPPQIHQHQQIQTAQSISHPTSPYAPQPALPPHIPQNQIQQPHVIAPQLPSQNQASSPVSRKRKAPGGVPSPSPNLVSSLPPQMRGPPQQMSADPQAQTKVEEGEEEIAAPPPPKKNRTNTPWSPAEEALLRRMRDAGKSWSEIAKSFPSRTEGSVKKHWYKDMHYAEFAEDESQALLNAIKEYEQNKWKFIGQKVGKPAKNYNTTTET
ncbi:uncharacterized protein KY384_001387 [Bacidia gigantensis]|uniref:uncharacterized protein n=1 Tax=Bacidia gigantensis TaxID=2732470 RepID=UPI001D036881|nr:uncharacterized protein KY384_001387 [Bacidia gigantensis]KAG8533646.1 hypothetical protein KY384_001387 [Bacidia gigantensis]